MTPQWGEPLICLLLTFIYRGLVAPVAFLVLLFIGVPWNKKIREGFKMRWTQGGVNPCLKAPKDSQPVWIHCASGEFEYAKPLIRQFKSRGLPILVTYFSPSYRRQIESDPLVDYAVPLPWDLPGPCHSFLCHYKPRALFIARTDLWPELLTQCGKKGLPCYLFSASLPQIRGSKKIFSFYHRWVFNKLTRIGVVHSTDFKNFKSLGVSESSLQISGDTRYDQVFHRLQHSSIPAPKTLCGPTLVAGSTWPVDETQLLDGLSEFIENQQLNLIIAPHEPTPHHLSRLEKALSQRGLPFCRTKDLAKKSRLARNSHSSPATSAPMVAKEVSAETLTANIHEAAHEKRHETDREKIEWDSWEKGHILIVDRVGILAEIYPWADFAFIGGSFDRKVHSVMEPLAAGCVCFVGPHHINNSEAVELKESYLSGSKLRFVNVVSSGRKLKEWVGEALSEDLKGPQSEIVDLMASRTGASHKISQWPLLSMESL